MHCNPAPPHPPPGEVYNVICPPTWGDIGLIVGLAVVLAIGGILLSWATSLGESDMERINGENV